ncbi:hypothetical protein [Methanococcus maripaludis]|uniref:Uncharacterized protein n=1 Tax=Methanococcus maripaludis TaxID=39152 RepID=A0A7J9PSG7_METMI|nr:hypothetical protein [Methanococcus maripaludis]MBA2864439.1 hypothetical protein [Methanococcus maripaludis]
MGSDQVEEKIYMILRKKYAHTTASRHAPKLKTLKNKYNVDIFKTKELNNPNIPKNLHSSFNLFKAAQKSSDNNILAEFKLNLENSGYARETIKDKCQGARALLEFLGC